MPFFLHCPVTAARRTAHVSAGPPILFSRNRVRSCADSERSSDGLPLDGGPANRDNPIAVWYAAVTPAARRRNAPTKFAASRKTTAVIGAVRPRRGPAEVVYFFWLVSWEWARPGIFVEHQRRVCLPPDVAVPLARRLGPDNSISRRRVDSVLRQGTRMALLSFAL
jgi:hypothetical protein